MISIKLLLQIPTRLIYLNITYKPKWRQLILHDKIYGTNYEELWGNITKKMSSDERKSPTEWRIGYVAGEEEQMEPHPTKTKILFYSIRNNIINQNLDFSNLNNIYIFFLISYNIYL